MSSSFWLWFVCWDATFGIVNEELRQIDLLQMKEWEVYQYYKILNIIQSNQLLLLSRRYMRQIEQVHRSELELHMYYITNRSKNCHQKYIHSNSYEVKYSKFWNFFFQSQSLSLNNIYIYIIFHLHIS